MSESMLDQLVPARGGPMSGTIDRDALREDIAAIARAIHARGGGHWLVYENDPHRFAAALYGIVLGGGDATLLPDDRPGTVSALGRAFHGQVGVRISADNPVATGALAAEGAGSGLPATPSGRVVVLTSGSSGARKHLTRGLGELLAEAGALQARWPGGESCINASMVSSHHMYGLMFAVVWPLMNGARLMATPMSPVPDFTTLDDANGQPLRLITSPSYLHRLQSSLSLASLEDRGGRAVAVERMFSAGAPLDPDQARDAAHRFGCAVNEIYGSSETGAVATRRADLGENWQALPCVTLDAEDGRLVIEAPSAAREVPAPYVSADTAAFVDGGFRLLGRADRIIKVEGKRVSLQAIEDAACRVELVHRCSAALDGDGRNRVALAAVLSDAGLEVLHRDNKPAVDRLIRIALRDEFESVILPRRLRYLAAIPLDAQGKACRDALQAAFADGARRRPTLHGTTRNGEWIELELALDPDMLPFEGHFPAFAVLPGVALVDWAMKYAGEQFGTAVRATRLSDVKFTSILRPGDRVTLSMRHADHLIEYRYSMNGAICAKGRVGIDESA